MKCFKNTVRRGVAFVTAFAIAFGAMVFFAPVDAYAARVFYSLAEDEMLQEQEAGHIMSPYIYPAEWMNAGSMEYEVIETPRGFNGIRFFNRVQDWAGIDFQAEEVGLNFATTDVAIFVSGRAGSDVGTMAIQGTGSPWPHIVSITDFGPGGTFEVFVPSFHAAMREHENFVESNPDRDAGQFSPLAFQRNLRINPVSSTGEFTLYEVVIAEPGWTPAAIGGAAAPAPAPAPAPAAHLGDVEVPAGYTTGLRFVVGSTSYTVNDNTSTLDAAPFNQDGRVMVPLRQIGEAIGAANIAFEDNTAIIDDIRLPIGQELTGGMGTPVIVDGRTFVPLGYIAQRIGATPRWDGDINAAFIYIP